MTPHPNHDSADENDGKYRADEEITFEGVLKASLRERAEHQKTLDNLVKKDRGPAPSEPDTKKHRKQSRDVAAQQREETASTEREELATAIGEAHAAKRSSSPIASGETTQIGLHTTYEFTNTKIDDQTYYYVAQTTVESYEHHEGTLAVKDFGTEWSYSVPSIDTEALQNVIARRRQEDLRAGREPVAWLTENQIDAIEKWYLARTESELFTLEEDPHREGRTVHVFDQYFVADVAEEALTVGTDLDELTDRQVNAVLESLLTLVETKTDLPSVLYDDLRESIDYPLLARITFDPN
ncbi:hypothetical protein HTG_00105 [Natrinema mahii]|nr:hypothetical protein HTG_00105 [Natrinema mahii]